MNQKLFHNCDQFCCRAEKSNEDLTLQELRDKIFEITEKQNYISNCGLSAKVESLAIKELQEQKDELKAIMHKKVDEL